MAGPFRTITVALNANTTGYVSGLRVAARETQSFDSASNKATKSASGAWAKMGLLAKGAGIGVALALFQAGRSAVEFEARMRNVNSISGLSERQLAGLSKQVLGLTKSFPQSANQLAEGLYDIASSGFQGAEGLQVLRASAKAASAGLTSTQNSAQAITATLNAYGLEATDAVDVSDTLFQTVNVGVVSFEQLSGVIGDVVGTAAAATVGIDEVGAAIATMTLSGISADESGTSLNRMLQALIDPSDALAQALNDVGYESGAQALKVDDLSVVMGKLNEKSEGNIETLLAWFPEIRAARGALALAAAGGDNYARSVEAMTDAHKGAGATQKAFAEQMKSAKAQLTLLWNEVQTAGIVLGTNFLPVITGGIDKLRELGSEALPFVKDRLGELGGAVENLVEILQEAWDWAGDFITLLGQIGGTAILGAIAGLTSGLEFLTQELSEHPGLIHAITAALIVLGAVKTWDVMVSGAAAFSTAATTAFRALSASSVGEALRSLKLVSAGFQSIGTGAGTAGTQIASGLSGAWAAIGPVTAGIVVLTAAISAYNHAQASGDARAGRFWDQFEGDVDLTNITKVRESLKLAQGALEGAEAQQKRNTGGPLRTIQKWIEDAGPAKDKLSGYNKQVEHGRETVERLTKLTENYDHNVKDIKKSTGLTTGEVQTLANKVGVDLTGAYAKTEKGRLKIIALAESHKKLAAQATKSGVSVEAALKLPDEELQKLVDAQADMSKFVSTMGLLGPTVTAQEGMTGTAFEGMAKDAQKFIEGVSQSFADYGDVLSGFGDQQDITGKEISKFYREHIKGAEKFSDNINKAVSAGYDPQLIARILQAGPEQAAPFLESLVANQSDTFVFMTNNAEKALADINQRAVEMARLTNIAITQLGSDGAAELGKAMEISQKIAALGGTATAEQLAFALGSKVEDIKRIAGEYGIALAAGLGPLLKGIGAAPIQLHIGRTSGRGFAVPEAEGGFIDPAIYGDTRRDSVPAVLMPGEVVIRRSSVQKFGAKNLLDLNAGRMPFAAGGFVLPSDVPLPPNVSGHGTMVGKAGGDTMGYEYRAVVDWVKKNSFGSAGPPSGAVQQIAARLLAGRGWANQWSAFASLVAGESGWNVHATNPSSGAYGIPQALPPGKMASAGSDWRDNPATQIRWMLDYIGGRYGDPANAYRTWSSRSPHWYSGGGQVLPMGSYDRGGYLPKGLSLAYNGTGQPEPVGHGRGPTFLTVKIGNETLVDRMRLEIGENNKAIVTAARKGAV